MNEPEYPLRDKADDFGKDQNLTANVEGRKRVVHGRREANGLGTVALKSRPGKKEETLFP
jgi:hypothetical protein